MNALRILIALACLLAGLFLGTGLVDNTVMAGEEPGSHAAWVDAFSSEALSRSEHARLLVPQAPETVIAAVGAAIRLMLMPEDDQVFLPIVRH